MGSEALLGEEKPPGLSLCQEQTQREGGCPHQEPVSGHLDPDRPASRTVRDEFEPPSLWCLLRQPEQSGTPSDPAMAQLSVHPGEMTPGMQTSLCTHAFTTTQRWGRPRCPSTDGRMTSVVHPYDGMKEAHSDTCYIIDEPQKQTKEKEPGHQGSHSVRFHLCEKTRTGKSRETESIDQ